jgi:hypothetical protein
MSDNAGLPDHSVRPEQVEQNRNNIGPAPAAAPASDLEVLEADGGWGRKIFGFPRSAPGCEE